MSPDPYLVQLGRNIRAARTKRGLRQVDIEEKCGLTYRHYQDIEAGKVNLTVETLIRLAKAFRVPVAEFFLNLEKQAEEKETGFNLIPFHPDLPRPKGSVPVYPLEIAAGRFDSERETLEPEGWCPVFQAKGKLESCFAAKVTGCSMEPTIPDGALCLFRPYTGGSRSGRILLVRAPGLTNPETGGSFVIKRYQRRDKARVELVSDNAEHKPIILKGLSEDEISTPYEFVKVLG